jgi:hypothetical protein
VSRRGLHHDHHALHDHDHVVDVDVNDDTRHSTDLVHDHVHIGAEFVLDLDAEYDQPHDVHRPPDYHHDERPAHDDDGRHRHDHVYVDGADDVDDAAR